MSVAGMIRGRGYDPSGVACRCLPFFYRHLTPPGSDKPFVSFSSPHALRSLVSVKKPSPDPGGIPCR